MNSLPLKLTHAYTILFIDTGLIELSEALTTGLCMIHLNIYCVITEVPSLKNSKVFLTIIDPILFYDIAAWTGYGLCELLHSSLLQLFFPEVMETKFKGNFKPENQTK